MRNRNTAGGSERESVSGDHLPPPYPPAHTASTAASLIETSATAQQLTKPTPRGEPNVYTVLVARFSGRRSIAPGVKFNILSRFFFPPPFFPDGFHSITSSQRVNVVVRRASVGESRIPLVTPGDVSIPRQRVYSTNSDVAGVPKQPIGSSRCRLIRSEPLTIFISARNSTIRIFIFFNTTVVGVGV